MLEEFGKSSIYLLNEFQPLYITFSSGVSIDLKTMEVTFPEGMEISEVSKKIYEGLKTCVPNYYGEIK